ncbi:hypothetical protein Plhal304r1_c034g0106541 [Plasmopara halstedii]
MRMSSFLLIPTTAIVAGCGAVSAYRRPRLLGSKLPDEVMSAKEAVSANSARFLSSKPDRVNVIYAPEEEERMMKDMEDILNLVRDSSQEKIVPHIPPSAITKGSNSVGTFSTDLNELPPIQYHDGQISAEHQHIGYPYGQTSAQHQQGYGGNLHPGVMHNSNAVNHVDQEISIGARNFAKSFKWTVDLADIVRSASSRDDLEHAYKWVAHNKQSYPAAFSSEHIPSDEFLSSLDSQVAEAEKLFTQPSTDQEIDDVLKASINAAPEKQRHKIQTWLYQSVDIPTKSMFMEPLFFSCVVMNKINTVEVKEIPVKMAQRMKFATQQIVKSHASDSYPSQFLLAHIDDNLLENSPDVVESNLLDESKGIEGGLDNVLAMTSDDVEPWEKFMDLCSQGHFSSDDPLMQALEVYTRLYIHDYFIKEPKLIGWNDWIKMSQTIPGNLMNEVVEEVNGLLIHGAGGEGNLRFQLLRRKKWDDKVRKRNIKVG